MRYSKMKGKDVKIIGPVIIESLAVNDKKTGKIFYEEILKFKTFKEPSLSIFYFDEQTKESFLKRFELIVSKIKNENYFPFIHIESHGSENGIHLGSGEDLAWKELMPYLIEINILLRNMLILSLGTCYGISLISAIDPIKRAPFRVVLGATKEITETDILVGFEKYFEIFFFSFNSAKALDEMNRAIGVNKFFMITDEECFDKLVDPNRDPVFFKEMIMKISIERYLLNPEYRKQSFGEVFVKFNNEARAALGRLKGRKGYFCMRDIRKKMKL